MKACGGYVTPSYMEKDEYYVWEMIEAIELITEIQEDQK